MYFGFHFIRIFIRIKMRKINFIAIKRYKFIKITNSHIYAHLDLRRTINNTIIFQLKHSVLWWNFNVFRHSKRFFTFPFVEKCYHKNLNTTYWFVNILGFQLLKISQLKCIIIRYWMLFVVFNVEIFAKIMSPLINKYVSFVNIFNIRSLKYKKINYLLI